MYIYVNYGRSTKLDERGRTRNTVEESTFHVELSRCSPLLVSLPDACLEANLYERCYHSRWEVNNERLDV